MFDWRPVIQAHRTRFAIAPDLRESAGGWTAATGRWQPNANPQAMEVGYADALEAWRKNPYAKRIIDVITDYCIGDGIRPTARGDVGRFVDRFWTHPQNHLDIRLPDLVDELSRAGDLFLVLFRNNLDGISYVRSVPKSEIRDIRVSPTDWETELEYLQRPIEPGGQDLRWLNPKHPDAAESDAIMLHYAINRPVGALLGESELATIIPWLQRYSRMLEDRVRLNWAMRSFLWLVTVPSNQVDAKAAQYANPPEPGSIIVKDDAETWESSTPSLGASDAQHDLRALRQAISAGSGQPPHWHGDGGDINRANAEAMTDPATRHLRRRQRHLQYMIQDMCAVAYSRAHAIGRGRNQPKPEAITVPLPDISRTDNQTLAASANALMSAFASMTNALGSSPTLNRAIIEQAFEFAGTPLDPDELDRILAEQEAEKRKTQAQQQQQKPEPAAAAPMPIVVKQNGH